MRPSLDILVRPLDLLVVPQLLLVPKDCNKLAIPNYLYSSSLSLVWSL